MNSQIYCLPQKHGFNAVYGTSWERYEEQKKYLNQKSTKPFFKVLPEGQPRDDSITQQTSQRLPRLGVTNGDTSLHFAFSTQYESEFGLHSVPPVQRRPIPKTHEATPHPINNKRRQYHPPLQAVHPTLGTPANDSDRGLYEWRYLVSPPGTNIWGEPMKAIPFWSYVGRRYTLPPVRVFPHDPVHETERWNNIKALDCRNRLPYGYRRHVPGYTGHVGMVEAEDLSSCHVKREGNAMESTVQASYRELPDDFYNHGQTDNVNKHKGPLSRMVTLTHPFNPFTQQSAYSNMGSTDTTPSK